MAVINTIASQRFLSLSNSTSTLFRSKSSFNLPSSSSSCIRISAVCPTGARRFRPPPASVSINDGLDVIPVQSVDLMDQLDAIAPLINREGENDESCLDQPGPSANQIVGFAFESRGDGGVEGGLAFSSSSSSSGSPIERGDQYKIVDRIINASIVLAAGSFAVTKMLTVDSDYWHGWTLYEIVRYAPLHNWTAYEDALKTNPVLAKMMISGAVYSIGDWIAQCYSGKPLFDFDRARMLRSGLTGFALHGSLSHYYYEICEYLFPFHDWWVVPVKVAFDQTVWSAIWNSIYYVVVGFLRLESPANIFSELKATFWPMLTAGWKLWPFAHLITYGVIPVEQRLLWVDCVELVWVMILSTYSNEKSEARLSEAISELSAESQSVVAPEEMNK
ncbi:uncharacterized protein LOC110114095 [Dendrobium catenatum]|uniref:Peroxisomal membrane protein 2 n=1 Tax=Dendrobium catenatum TaxID=906689 RepID=A0A2I0WYJ7_9ASPA|nr:uncharacterized protein LOC110114095 [Dendrobium catenatum]PKU80728.1 hypothetical protein MA16_Dca023915 [Dendrobium catenatum]